MSDGHDASGAVEGGAVIIPISKFRFAGMDAHANAYRELSVCRKHGSFYLSLPIQRRIDGLDRRRKNRVDSIACSFYDGPLLDLTASFKMESCIARTDFIS